VDADVLVVGAGPCGLTAARLLAEAGRSVTVVERRGHVGGNAWSEADPATGIEIHRYGAHLFHTANERVWAFVNRFTAFTGYEHRVWTTHKGEVYPLPVNLGTINQFFRAAYTPDQAQALIAEQAAPMLARLAGREPASLDEKAVALIGQPLYEAFIRGYTAKQWQVAPELLPASVISRLPVRYNYDTRYFNDPHQGLPVGGYGRLWEALADHPRVNVRLEEDCLAPDGGPFTLGAVRGQLPVLYTGPVDRYFGYRLGRLGWRTLDFQWEHHPVGDYQGCAVMNYADLEVPYTRVIEFRHFHPERRGVYPGDATVTATEFSRVAGAGDEVYYPVGTPADRELLERYRLLAVEEPLVWFGGRLGRYQYLDMDAAIAAGFALAAPLLEG
jgi:UDP-galactopyranose mutase